MPVSLLPAPAGVAVPAFPLGRVPPDDGIWWREFTCVVCGRHYAEDLGRCPVDGGLLRLQLIAMPFLWLG